MKDLINYDTLKILNKSISSNIGIYIKQKLWILINFQYQQLSAKASKAQHHLIYSSYKIQKAYADTMGYKIKDIPMAEEQLENIIKVNIKYELISGIQEYYSFKEFLQNLLFSLFLTDVVDEVKVKQIQEIKIENEFEYILYKLKDKTFESEKDLLKCLNSEINSLFKKAKKDEDGKESKKRSKEITKLKLKPLLEEYGLWDNYDILCKFFSKPEVKEVFHANEIKHYFIPLGFDNFKFSINDYLDPNKKNIKLEGGMFGNIDLDISKTQDILEEFNNLFVDFVNAFFEKYRF